MEGNYRITLKSQLGPKCGIFCFKQVKRKLFVNFTFLGHENRMTGKEEAGEFEIKGKIMTTLGLRECKISGNALGDEIDAEMFIDSKIYQLTGMKLDNDLKGEDE